MDEQIFGDAFVWVFPLQYGPGQGTKAGKGPFLMTMTMTATAGADNARLYIYDNSTGSGTLDMQVDDIICVQGSSAPLGFTDGDVPGGSWSGTPGQSASSGPVWSSTW